MTFGIVFGTILLLILLVVIYKVVSTPIENKDKNKTQLEIDQIDADIKKEKDECQRNLELMKCDFENVQKDQTTRKSQLAHELALRIIKARKYIATLMEIRANIHEEYEKCHNTNNQDFSKKIEIAQRSVTLAKAHYHNPQEKTSEEDLEMSLDKFVLDGEIEEINQEKED
ncbi:hypothetical protein EIN_377660 [Entamoeba invadens IP1]|uniref:Uncharacterized protein n=1 Tax=Entamoeba invadens IP1 TaxID=370355 RepID=A0A0A1TYD8_ENTIV|nr:hypothetical protein EIN_377660 [Entamoeba invadens IP1]ELP83511.1 hypothetical protein EIN_377660 [Entamoeba invadens IP1]|eukprot:XP_004182857.1 hypothetical protein EIN_377660 [Entamoeba invadens IP1]